MDNQRLQLKTTTLDQIKLLINLSTERLIIWIVGRSYDLNKILSSEDIVIECWMIQPEKHSLRGYNQYPDSHAVKKRIGEMKGKKGLLTGSEMNGYNLTEISIKIYYDLIELVKNDKILVNKGKVMADRSISSISEAPYKKLIKTTAYIKYKEDRIEEIVETDFLYFYGLNWHSRLSFIKNRFKNIDSVVKQFSERDIILKAVHEALNNKFQQVKIKLLNNK